jgi:predicted lipoprotein with Yx(FWY)xxD motif
MRAALLATLLIGAIALTACGSSSSGGNSSGSSGGSGSSSSATVITKKVAGYGTVLATPSGKTLYLSTADPAGGSKCTGSCTSTWPPLTAKGSPGAGAGVDSSMLSSFKRSDGTEQVVYNKHALYTHTGSGLTSGAGVAANGGIWYLVSPSGNPIKSTTGGGY